MKWARSHTTQVSRQLKICQCLPSSTHSVEFKILVLTFMSLHNKTSSFLDNQNFPTPSSKRVISCSSAGFSIFVYSGGSTWKALLPLQSLLCSKLILNAICTIKHTCTHTSLLFIFVSLLLLLMALYTFMALLCLKKPHEAILRSLRSLEVKRNDTE